jgi:YfiH family protein
MMITWMEYSGLRIGTFPALEALAPSLRVWFTARSGGVSAPPYDSLNLGSHVGDRRSDVLENRRRLKDALGIGPNRVARGGQVHGTGIAQVSRGGAYAGTDGFLTLSRELALAINSADCFPLVIHSPSEMVLAALHVGRSGAAGGIIEKAFGILRKKHRIDIANTVAVCGPGICRRCYEVGERAAKGFPASSVIHRGGSVRLDLPRFIRTEAEKAGVRPANYFDSGLCTSCDEDLFSYRRDGGVTGRNWTLAMMINR